MTYHNPSQEPNADYNQSPKTSPIATKPPKRKWRWLVPTLIFVGVVIVLCCVANVFVAVLTKDDTTPPPLVPTSAPASTTAATKGVTATARPSPPITIKDGVWTVGKDMPPGDYRLKRLESPKDLPCYWQISKAGSNGKDIEANGLVEGGHPIVTLKKGSAFESSHCGVWERVD